MRINELVFEITRRCNIACRHCLRGDPQNKDIDNVTIDKALDGVDSIGMITFTGGEPTLAVDRIRYITEQIIKRGISLDGFYIITNGKIASKELIHALIDLYANVEYKDENYSVLCISQDQYHTEEIDSIREARDLYKALSFFNADYRKEKLQMLINEGRTYEGMADSEGKREAFLNDLTVECNDDGEIESVDGTVYVNALGDVITSCDMSFESQEQNKIGNVNDKPLSEILVAYLNQVT
jgi:sulfatase maturation enzyme AslB (radical SAM superfamily)